MTTHLQEEDAQWALERYGEDRNHEIMVASAEVEYEGYLPVVYYFRLISAMTG